MTKAARAFFILFLAAVIGAGGCARLSLAWTSLDVTGAAATPPALGPFGAAPAVLSAEDWEKTRAPLLRAAFQDHVYGRFPDASSTRIVARNGAESAFEGAIFETYDLRVTATFDDEAADSDVFAMELFLPADAKGPSPVVLIQTFCDPTHERVYPAVTGGGPGVTCNGGPLTRAARLVFGTRIATAPIERLLAAGYGAAILYPKAVIPDRPRAGLDALDALAPMRAESDARWGAIAAWGWLYSRMVDALQGDPRIDAGKFVALGHSRFGKAALVAAAFDARIAAVISNQSGTGGASLSRAKKGETVRQITKSYPHWFATRFDDYAGRESELPVDQHLLLALIAPRPILLGNARRDVWSDPNGAFRAAQGADPVYELFGRAGLDQEGMRDFNPGADIAYWLRGGPHSVGEKDWDAFFAFLERHAPPASPP